MEYRILLLRNEVPIKILNRVKTSNKSRELYKEHLKNSSQVKFERLCITSNNITNVTYEICRVKEFEPKDEERIVRDKVGRLCKAKIINSNGKWTILDSNPFNVEETFYVFGFNPRNDRKEIDFIIGLMVRGINDSNLTKNIVTLNNKLIILNEHQFDIVLCKTKYDAKRLHDTLFYISEDNKLKRLLFMGEASELMVGKFYKMLMERTGWDYRKVRRVATNT